MEFFLETTSLITRFSNICKFSSELYPADPHKVLIVDVQQQWTKRGNVEFTTR